MVDPASLTFVIAGLAAGGAAGYGVWIQRSQHQAVRAQLAAAKEQIDAFRKLIKGQEDALGVARTDLAIRALLLELDGANPIDKAAAVVKEVLDRGVAKMSAWRDRKVGSQSS
jgi:hypothetical protein